MDTKRDIRLINQVYDRCGQSTAEFVAVRMGYTQKAFCEACEEDEPYTYSKQGVPICLICWSTVYVDDPEASL